MKWWPLISITLVQQGKRPVWETPGATGAAVSEPGVRYERTSFTI